MQRVLALGPSRSAHISSCACPATLAPSTLPPSATLLTPLLSVPPRYEDGKYLAKRNTFSDFIACAEHLVAHKYTSPSRLCIQGRSGAGQGAALALALLMLPPLCFTPLLGRAVLHGGRPKAPCTLSMPRPAPCAAAGGLTMGAVINMRPDLFHAAILGERLGSMHNGMAQLQRGGRAAMLVLPGPGALARGPCCRCRRRALRRLPDDHVRPLRCCCMHACC